MQPRSLYLLQMLSSRLAVRHFFTAQQRFQAANKSALAKLRKKTGYSLSVCKKALETTEQDLAKAEAWLKEQAQAQGWAKANKLEGRNTTQGLIGVLIRNNVASMVELNCETDFVARNKDFHELLNEVNAVTLELLASESTQELSIKHVVAEELAQIKMSDGKCLADLVALKIGKIGENIQLRRGATFSVPQSEGGIQLTGLTHPSANIHSTNVQYGRYGTILAFTKDQNVGQLPEDQTVTTMARQFCQHVIGMNPVRIGDANDIENKNADEDMVHQEFLMDQEFTVGEILAQTGMKINGFLRYEVGQSLD